MAARRKPSKPSAAYAASKELPPEEKKESPSKVVSEDLPLRPPKLVVILPAAAVFFVPFFYLVFVHYRIEPELRRSIAISAAMSFAGFAVVVRLIPVAARYVLRRNLFGYDINKKGTPQAAIKVGLWNIIQH